MVTELLRIDLSDWEFKESPISYFKNIGVEVFRSVYSSFGACFFIEVKQGYDKEIKGVFSLEKSPDLFDWNI